MEFTCHYLLVPRGTFNVILHTDLEFPWNSPAIISVVPRGTFDIFLDTDLESMEFTCHYLCYSTWNIQSVLDTDLEFPWNSPAIISLFHVEHSIIE